MPDSDLLDWIALNLLDGWGPVMRARALERFGSPGDAAYRADPGELRRIAPRGASGFGRARLALARRDLRRRADAELSSCRRLGIRLLALSDHDYPALLREITDPPILLYVRGELPAGVPRISIVGSRRATEYGLRVAGGMASGLASRGIEVVSGGARGIDTAAHVGAMEAEGRTVAVLGSGFHDPYPTENRSLFDRMAASGAVISEFPLDYSPQPRNFPMRNRIISALSAAVVVVEAEARSGSLVTARHALEQGREVMAVPGPVTSSRSVGCHRLIQDGAKLVQNTGDILDELSPMYTAGLVEAGDPARSGTIWSAEKLSEDERAVVALLDEVEPVHLDDLADAAPFGIARLQVALFGLEIQGAVEHSPGRYYLLRPREEP
jgi:DNA processing protein